MTLSKPSDTGRYNDIKLKILRFSRKVVGCGEGKNLFSREKKDNGADVRPSSPDAIDPCREQRVVIYLPGSGTEPFKK